MATRTTQPTQMVSAKPAATLCLLRMFSNGRNNIIELFRVLQLRWECLDLCRQEFNRRCIRVVVDVAVLGVECEVVVVVLAVDAAAFHEIVKLLAKASRSQVILEHRIYSHMESQ